MISLGYRFIATLLAGLILPVIHQSAHAQDQKPMSLTVKQAKDIVAGKNVELLRSVTELNVEAAQVLTQYSKSDLRLPRVQKITPEVAKALAQTTVTLSLGLTTITPEVARALATRPKGMLALDGLKTISVEEARELAQFRGKLTLNGLTTLSPEVARELAKHKSKLTLTGLTEISDEAAEALSHHGQTMLLNGLTRLSSASLTATVLRSNDGFAKFPKVQTISDAVAKVLAEYRGTKTYELPELTELSEANAALLRANKKIVLPAKFQGQK